MRPRPPDRTAQQHPHPTHHHGIGDLDRHPLIRTRLRHPRRQIIGRHITQTGEPRRRRTHDHCAQIAGGPCQPSSVEDDQNRSGPARPSRSEDVATTSAGERPHTCTRCGVNPCATS